MVRGPVLPEAELRKRLIEFFSICSNFLAKPPGQGEEALSKRLTLIPIESVHWVRGLKGRSCPEGEVKKMLDLTATMRRLALHLSSRARREAPALPESILPFQWAARGGSSLAREVANPIETFGDVPGRAVLLTGQCLSGRPACHP